jgi:uncharacterized lipoprotein YehR (DUF1307 family)
MKKALCMLFAVILTLNLVGCAKVVKTETKVVEATIIEVDCDPAMKVGTAFEPADYDILLKYEDVETWIDVSRSEYDKYEDLVGTTIKVNLVIIYYDDGIIKQYLEIEE